MARRARVVVAGCPEHVTHHGRPTALTRVAGGVTKATAYSHNAAHELTQLIYSEDAAAQYTKTYGYDTAGRTTRVTKQGSGLTTVIHTYDWDAADRLTRAQVDAGGNVKTIEYAYNAAGLRVRRIDASSNVTKLYSCILGTFMIGFRQGENEFPFASAGIAATLVAACDSRLRVSQSLVASFRPRGR
ncbi:MAG TPA: hypothetical protein VM492_16325 [Sumerlaeia bacterium]|nr:hypothetical protein [Sumerlaeia bacterium]